MGLSSKQVSGDGFDWAKNLMQNGALELPNVTPIRQQQQPVPTLKCPRCESTNTKFCYYNNYNRSQPRHFCKSCRRHWTKGGTLRNVPVGGGRKNKKLKTSSSTTSTTNNKNDKTSHGSKITKDLIQPGQQVQQQLSLGLGDERKFSEILYQSLLQSTTSPLVPSLQSNYINSNLLNSALSLDPLLPLPNLPSTSLSAFNNPSSSMSSPFNAGFQSPNVLNYSGEAKCSEDLCTSVTITPMPVQLQIPSTNSEVDSSSYWNWDDLNILI